MGVFVNWREVWISTSFSIFGIRFGGTWESIPGGEKSRSTSLTPRFNDKKVSLEHDSNFSKNFKVAL